MKSFLATGKTTVLELVDDLRGTKDGYEHDLFSNWCDNPKLAAYACCCPCCLDAQVSLHNGRNGFLSGCLSCFLPCAHYVFYRIPDRRQAAPSSESMVHSMVRASMPFGLGLVQTATVAGVKPGQVKMVENSPAELKNDTPQL